MRNRKIGTRILAPLLLVAILFSAGESFAGRLSLKVKSRTERTKVPSEDVVGYDRGVTTTTSLTETETCALAVTIKGTKELSGSGQLECYFLSKNIKRAGDKGTVVVFSCGKKKFGSEMQPY